MFRITDILWLQSRSEGEKGGKFQYVHVYTVLSRASAHPCVSAHPPVLISLLSGRLLRVSAHLVFIPVLHNTMQYTNWPCRG